MLSLLDKLMLTLLFTAIIEAVIIAIFSILYKNDLFAVKEYKRVTCGLAIAVFVEIIAISVLAIISAWNN